MLITLIIINKDIFYMFVFAGAGRIVQASFNHTGNNFYLYRKLAWEHSVVQSNLSFSRRLPALGRFYRETKFSL